MFGKIIDLLIRLLKEREANKQIVLKECLQPLKAELDVLHQRYLKDFHSYKEALSKGAATDALLSSVSIGLDQSIVQRQRIGGQLAALLKVSNARLDTYKELAFNFARSTVEYLEGHTFEGIESVHELPGSVSIGNPFYHSIHITLRSNEERQLMIDLLERALVTVQHRFGAVERHYADFRAFLLS